MHIWEGASSGRATDPSKEPTGAIGQTFGNRMLALNDRRQTLKWVVKKAPFTHI